MKALLLLSLLVTLAATTTVTTFKECTDGPSGVVKSLDVTADCSSGACHMQHNHNVTLSVTFQSGSDITEAKTVVYGIIFGALKVPDPFPGMPPNACQNIVGGCPVTAGTTRTYNATVFVQPFYPKLRLAAQWELHDQANHKVFCFVVPVEVVD
ncbi:NPC intracellular cholesterol transporter 2-like [Pomacea canaliculata]|uniref:NPC intracellular cholesterol transporter 2-like n=1 Tax=Pomacea canaliculata TaxID=400727 RepID=UPI000D738041|nr:NPC intracellular cholesterol transporter 2-like [Pomacea canaliculata]